MAPGWDIGAAYRHCEEVTRTQARNFSYGIRLLPAAKRRALSAVYAFARRIDDIGDGPLGAEDKLPQLARARAALRQIDDRTDDPVLVALAHAARRFPIPLAAFEELIDGCESDVLGTRYATFGDLLHYCRCVAGSIGRLSLGVFGTTGAAPGADAARRADALGVALQLTNILRDIREDHMNGRVYLPAEDLDRFGCRLRPEDDGAFLGPPAKVAELIRFEAERARTYYDEGLTLLPLLDRRSAACTAAMAGIYRRLLERIAADPAVVLRARLSLPTWEKAVVAARSLAGARP